jgi:4-hydroxythreonine-4-phosphate dehydrogenase
MILVTQGHERSISLEVFLKSFLCLSKNKQSQIKLYCYLDSLVRTLDSINLSYNISSDLLLISNCALKLNVLDKDGSESLNCINEAIKDITATDILLTLPTSKDQFEGFNGHTEYFRDKFRISNIPMSFLSKNLNVSLLTDHVSVKDISSSIDSNNIIAKLSILIKGFSSHKTLKRVIFSGINPHNGEDGLMGDEEEHIYKALTSLKTSFKHIEFLGPYPGDTLIFNDIKDTDLVIFSSHDQGLGIFKQQSGLLGINITYGLPFLRISPDHGTAIDLYLKNKANYYGCLYLLETFIK